MENTEADMKKFMKFELILRDVMILFGLIELIVAGTEPVVLHEMNIGIWGIVLLVDIFLNKAEG